jgi:sugar O-acyltransferase (sialic acid O-acetyltransferase NeuD family)
MRQLIIIGAGGFGREVYHWATEAAAHGAGWKIKGFIDDNLDALRGRQCPGTVIERVEDYAPQPEDVFVCAIGAPTAKKKCMQLLRGRGAEMTNVIHPTCVIGHDVQFGTGAILCPHSVVSANCSIGDGVALNLHVTVCHDVVVGDWCQINCHADVTGGVVLEDSVFVGSHASILPGMRVGRGAVIGAGAIVMTDVPAGVTVAATPARPLRL